MVVKIEESQDEIEQDAFDISCSKQSKSRKSPNLNEGGSSSFKGLSTVGSFGKMGGRSSGRIASENEWVDNKQQ